MIRWAFQSVGLVVDRLRSVLLQRSVRIGTWSISSVQNARNHFWDIVTTRTVDWPIVKLTTINFLVTCASFVIKSVLEMVSWDFLKIQCLTNSPVFTALNKAWCVEHFSCTVCDQKLTQKSKFYEYDEKPVCKKCYEKFPSELRQRLRESHENTLKKPV